jgi:hypothetical protein
MTPVGVMTHKISVHKAGRDDRGFVGRHGCGLE